jgi:hypothetical protein
MIPNLDTYRSANALVNHDGEDAPIEAAMRADRHALVSLRRSVSRDRGSI